jgi:uncharacterized protein (DUF111 family)
MTIERIGLGAGTRETRDRPNVLRVLIGPVASADAAVDTVAVVEASMDDATGEWIGHCVGRLLEAGALDAYCMPIYMKKNRPGVLLTAIVEHDRVDEIEAVIFAETPTFGLRRHMAHRSRLVRRHETVDTEFGTVRVKVGERHGGVVTASPEFDDCVEAAGRANVSVRIVMDAAMAAWRARRDKP